MFLATPPLTSEFMLLGDVGGQRTLRPYWRNYFEQTDALVWVVDSGDRARMQDCKQELHSLLTEDVSTHAVLFDCCLIFATSHGYHVRL